MKQDRKKAREETDIVNVVEYLLDCNGKKSRYVVLVKRPEKGTNY